MKQCWTGLHKKRNGSALLELKKQKKTKKKKAQPTRSSLDLVLSGERKALSKTPRQQKGIVAAKRRPLVFLMRRMSC